ncbi:Alpha/Beta hydrolase protein [Cyathus striatus]|nr:Alpha/Beta hydrolase protein [Cyathus striatus]
MNSKDTTTGKLDFKVGEETFQTWYKVIGDLNSGKRPLVLLHGGPGISHDYILPHIDLYTYLGIPLLTHLKDRPKDFWTVELFMDELDNVLFHFSIRDNFDLLGHSWGGMLAAQYAATRSPAGLQHLIIADRNDDSKEYQDVMNVFYGKHVCRANPWPEELIRSFAFLEANPSVYQAMQGPSEFTVTGTLKTWSIIDIVHNIKL